jgi:hypothetical protein
MNKSTGDDGEASIEILVELPEYLAPKAAVSGIGASSGNARGARTQQFDPSPVLQAKENRPVPERIRINSLLTLKLLKSIDDHISETTALVMMRPFKFLVYHEDQIEGLARGLEQQTGAEKPVFPPDEPSDFQGSRASYQLYDEQERTEALKHLRCLTSFTAKYIKPTLERLRDNSTSMISFADLWYIFQPGEDIHMPLKIQGTSINAEAVGISSETFYSWYNQLWRVTCVTGGRPNIATAQERHGTSKPNPFKVACYYIDFHGR